MKHIILAILVIHGLIHLMGFTKELGLAPVKELSGDTLITLTHNSRKAAGIAWLLSTILIVAFTVLWWLGKPGVWYIGAVGLVLSQLLIILYWKDAKFGSIANLILLLVTIYAYGQWQFSRMVQQEIQPIVTQQTPLPVITKEAIQHLPMPVQNWLTASGVVGKQQAYNARLKQQGQIRLSEEQAWADVKAEQYFDVINPGFVWTVNTRMKGMPIAGRDKYENGKGEMLIKPLTLFKAVDAKGAKTDQGSMMRYLSEICWIPTCALQDYLVWQEADSNSATVTMTYKGMSVTALYIFDEQHRLKGIKAKRYMGDNDEHLTDWYIPITHWGTFEGVTVPVKGDVLWQLPTGDFNYYRWEITDVNYNISKPY